MVRVITNGPGDWGSIPGQVILETQKMVLDATLLSTYHYKVRIKGKVEQSRERSSALPYTSVSGRPRLQSPTFTLITSSAIIASNIHHATIFLICSSSIIIARRRQQEALDFMWIKWEGAISTLNGWSSEVSRQVHIPWQQHLINWEWCKYAPSEGVDSYQLYWNLIYLIE